jgi:GntR family transcriptional regulator
MKIILSNSSKIPIYQQIIDQIKKQVIDGTLKEGDALPSIRSLARDLKVSVITSKRAYEELEKDGFIYSLVGKGSFVAEVTEQLDDADKLSAITEKFRDIVQESKESNMTRDELIAIIDILYKGE